MSVRRKKKGQREREERLLDLVDSLPETICETDTSGNLIYVNDSGLKAFGYTRNEYEAGLNVFHMLVPEERAQAKTNVERLFRGEDLGWIEHTALRKDGTTFSIEVHSSAVLHDGKPEGFRTIAIDTTQRKKVDAENNRNRENFECLYEYAPIAYHTLDSSGQITNVNEKWCQAFGYKKSEVIGKLVFDFIVPEERDNAISSFAERKKLKERFMRGHERQYLASDGRILTFVVNNFLFLDEHGDVVSVHTTLEDITERKNMEQNLRQSNMQLSNALEQVKKAQQHIIREERLKAVGQIANGVAHDFNNILMPILGLSELALSDPSMLNDTEETRRYFRQISYAANDARKIVRRMWKLYSSSCENDSKLVNLNKAVESSIMLARPKWQEELRANGQQIHIRTELGTIPEIRGVESQLHEILINLIFNAIDAIDKAGDIVIRTRLEGNRAVLDVEDTGCGMTEHICLRCLEPFFTTKIGTNSGLGLSIVQGIIHRHGGSVEVISQPGKGTTVRIWFPLPQVAVEVPEIAAEDYEYLSGLCILVIENDYRTRNVLERYLREDEHVVVTAGCGRDGLQKFGNEIFDLVIINRAMPDMSGDEVAAEIKKLCPETPVMMLTGFGDAMKENREIPDGVDVLIGKPVTLRELQQGIANLLHKQTDP